MKEISELQHLCVGTEVSAKYRGAFCEAQIKSIKRNISLRVLNHKDGCYYNLTEENVRGYLIKVGATVEAQFPESQDWLPGHIQAIKDKSSYTVVFDDGDERTLSRGSLCLKGDRHFATSETLDNLPLTDPENFGTPVLSNKKSRSRRRQSSSFQEEGEESDASNGPVPSPRTSKTSTPRRDSMDADYSSLKERQSTYLSDEMMGGVVLVEPTDKRKHWYPGLIVNPLCYDVNEASVNNQYIIRSFKTGKLAKVNKAIIKPLNKSTMPVRIDTPWKDIVKEAIDFKNSYKIPDTWKMEIYDIVINSESEDGDEENKKEQAGRDADSTDFLECLYKFMDDRGSPINKTPVLGNKDLDLCLLYQLVQERGGYYNVTGRDWHQIYIDLCIPKVNLAAAHNVRNSYKKYLKPYEEYLYSWNNQHKKDQSSKSDIGKRKKKSNDAVVNAVKKENRTRHNSNQNKPVSRATSRGSSPMSNSSTPCLDDTPHSRRSDDAPAPRRTSRRRRVSESSSVSAGSPSCNKQELPSTAKVMKQTAVQDDKGSKKKKFTKLKKFGDGDSDKEDQQSATTLSEIVTRRIRRNSTNSMTKFHIGDKLRVRYGEGKTFKPYQAKVIEVRHGDRLEDTRYLVHYAGWNQRHDEWISNARIMELMEECSASPIQVTKTARSTGTTPTASPYPGTHIQNPDFNGSKKQTANDNMSALPQPRSSASSILQKIPERSSNTDVLLKNVKNILGDLASDKEKEDNKILSTELKIKKEYFGVKKLNEMNREIMKVEVKLQQATTNNIAKPKTPSPTTSSRSQNNSPKTTVPQPRRTSCRRSKSPGYLSEFGTCAAKDNLSPLPIKEEENIPKVEFPLKQELPVPEKNRLSFGLATLPSDPTKNYLPPLTTTVMPVRQEVITNVKKCVETTEDDKTEDEKKYSSKDEEDENSKDDKSSTTDSAEESMEVDKHPSAAIATTESVLKSNASEENSTTQSDEEVSRILHRRKDEGSSESSNDMQATSDESAQFPTSSKVLIDNTPPHTPDQNEDYPDDKQLISDDAKVDNENCEAASSSDPHPLSLEYKSIPNNEEATIQETKKEVSGKKLVQRKRKRRSSKGRTTSTHDGDSESEYEQSCSNYANSTHRNKPRKKRAKKREIPDVPAVLDNDELARMSQEDRIEVLHKKMEELRRVYQQLKQEVSNIDRKRKKAKKREKEASEAFSNVSSPRNDSPKKSCTKSSNFKHLFEPANKDVPNEQ